MPRLTDPQYAPDCTIEVDGDRVPARAGERVTSALLAAQRPLLSRSAKYHRPRGPFCLAGSCTACLVRMDGTPNVRACQTVCREGLMVETQNAIGGAGRDLLGAIDLLAPKGIDHHHVATWSQIVNRVAVSASRRLAGLGRLPDRVPEPWPEAVSHRCDALVVGAGPAGLAAALALARAGRRVLLAEGESRLGGRLRCQLGLPDDPPLEWASEVAAAVARAGGEVVRGAAVIGLWPDGGETLAALPVPGTPPHLRLVHAQRVVLACGSWAQRPLFGSNDLPGIFAARGLAVSLAEDGVVPGERVAVLGEGPEAEAVERKLALAGMSVESAKGEIVRARGGRRLAAIDFSDGHRLRCDTLAVVTPRMPAAELAREVGAPLELDSNTGAFRVRPASDGAVATGIFAAGELSGQCSAAEAALSGQRAGEAAARG
jgi:sarcosine oxidase, subunit alpha